MADPLWLSEDIGLSRPGHFDAVLPEDPTHAGWFFLIDGCSIAVPQFFSD
jgi:hypothetical protein